MDLAHSGISSGGGGVLGLARNSAPDRVDMIPSAEALIPKYELARNVPYRRVIRGL